MKLFWNRSREIVLHVSQNKYEFVTKLLKRYILGSELSPKSKQFYKTNSANVSSMTPI